MDARDDASAGSAGSGAVVLVPVKAFGRAKVRLAPALGGHERAELARALAARVVAAAGPLPVAVVCDDDEVAGWARSVGAAVMWTPGLGLDGAVTEAVRRSAAGGVERAVVAHADLPFAAGLEQLAVAAPDEAVLVPDRRRDGTNVISVPTGAGFVFAYGAGSFDRHVAAAGRAGLRVRVEVSEQLGWDVDEPADLDAPAHLGVVPVPRGGAR